MIRIGVLSDTHLREPTDLFRAQVRACFADVSMILHAGDLMALPILEVFNGKEVHAVHGNMCSAAAQAALPRKKVITVGPFSIGLIHGMGYSPDIEERVRSEFDDIDCIVYGHTHSPICHHQGRILFMNPGSFTKSSLHWGAQGTYGILEVSDQITGTLCHVEPSK